MKTELLNYSLPQERIASRPPLSRDAGKMLKVTEQGCSDGWVKSFVDEIKAGDLVVLNQTKVRRARLDVYRPKSEQGGGAKVELLLLGVLAQGTWEALGKANRPIHPGDEFLLEELRFQVVDKSSDGTLELAINGDIESVLNERGAMPIPPYMKRKGDHEDIERYQTVFAQELGSAAAPTAGLHLTEEALAGLLAKGVNIARVRLHVGIGTFRPVSSDDLDQHDMHSEELEVTDEVVQCINRTKAQGGRVIAIGTTVVRALESSYDHLTDQLGPMHGATRLLIQPGYQFKVVDALLTNFHQPKSTLLALVSAFIGRERLMSAYQFALDND